MAGLHLLGPCRALLLLALLFPLETFPLGEGRGDPSAMEEDILWGGPTLPLIQLLRTQAPPPRARPSGRRRRQTSGQPLRYMLGLYRSMTDRHGQPRRNGQQASNTIRLIQPFAKAQQPGTGPWLVWTLDYHLEINPKVEHMVQVLAVYSRTQPSAHGHIWCTAKVLPDHHSAPPISLSAADLNATTATSSGKDSWVEIDLSAHFHPWGAWAGQKSWLLHLSHACVLMGKPQEPPYDPGGGKEVDLVSLDDPFLLLYLNDTQRSLRPEMDALGPVQGSPQPALARRNPSSLLRRTRQVDRLALDQPSYNHTNSARRNECALRPFRVSFRQLGLDHWIIAPNWYRPQYCKGACHRVLRYGYHSPNHAIIQSLINEMVDQRVPRPSCVPYKYGPISVLMVERNGHIIYKVYENMIAKSCTCR